MGVREMWRRMTATRYTRTLEAEVARQGAEIIRLRGENRALLNSILGIAGIPPIPVDLPDAGRGLGAASSAPTNDMNDIAVPLATQQGDPSVAASRGSRGTAPDDRAVAPSGHPPGRTVPLRNRTDRDRSMGNAQVIPPMRRRSWQQITRMLEFESARKTVASD